MTTGSRMKTRRKEIGISVDEIAAALGVSVATIYRYENGEIEKVPGSVLEPLSKVLRTTPSYLMGWDEDEPSTDDTSYSIQEMGLIKKYRQLPDSGKQAVDTMIDSMLMMAASQNSKSEDKDTIILAAKGGGLTKKELTPEQVDKLKKW